MVEEEPKRTDELTKMVVLSPKDKENLKALLLKWTHEEGILEPETSE